MQTRDRMNSSMKLSRKCHVLSSFHPCCRRGACWQSSSWCGGFNCHPELMIHRFVSFWSLCLGRSWMSCWQLKPNSSNAELFIYPSKSAQPPPLPVNVDSSTAALCPTDSQQWCHFALLPHLRGFVKCFCFSAASVECIFFPSFLPLTLTIASISVAFLTFCIVSPYVNSERSTTTCISLPFPHSCQHQHSPWTGAGSGEKQPVRK